MSKVVIYNSAELGALVAGLAQKDDYPITINYKVGSVRSISANAQFYVWLPQIARFYGEDNEFIRKWMKHHIAWPILEGGECEYSAKVRYMLAKAGYEHLQPQQKINMLDMFGVTRFFTTKQHNNFRDMVQIFWAKQGLQLNYINGD